MRQHDRGLEDPSQQYPAQLDALIGLGSNLGSRQAHLLAAVALLDEHPELHLQALSRPYRSVALTMPEAGPAPDYFNAALSLRTTLSPHALLGHLQRVENALGRTRETRWGSRTLDLDLLLHGEHRLDTEDLILPHAGLEKRAFVLEPLLEVWPDPTGHYGRLAARMSEAGLERRQWRHDQAEPSAVKDRSADGLALALGKLLGCHALESAVFDGAAFGEAPRWERPRFLSERGFVVHHLDGASLPDLIAEAKNLTRHAQPLSLTVESLAPLSLRLITRAQSRAPTFDPGLIGPSRIRHR